MIDETKLFVRADILPKIFLSYVSWSICLLNDLFVRPILDKTLELVVSILSNTFGQYILGTILHHIYLLLKENVILNSIVS